MTFYFRDPDSTLGWALEDSHSPWNLHWLLSGSCVSIVVCNQSSGESLNERQRVRTRLHCGLNEVLKSIVAHVQDRKSCPSPLLISVWTALIPSCVIMPPHCDFQIASRHSAINRDTSGGEEAGFKQNQTSKLWILKQHYCKKKKVTYCQNCKRQKV